jgi:DNA-binding transcriptional LysR family regulator
LGAIAVSEPETMLGWAVMGLGLVYSSDSHLQREIHAGRLTPVLSKFATRCPPLSVIFPKDRHLPSRVRVLIDYLIEKYPPGKRLTLRRAVD